MALLVTISRIRLELLRQPTFGDGTVSENYVITDAQTPWAAAKTDDKEKAEAIVNLYEIHYF